MYKMQNSKTREVVFLNGEFLDVKDAKIPLVSKGFLYGWGLFETMRSYNGKIIYLDEHLERLKSASKLINLKLTYTAAKLKEIIKKTLCLNAFKDACVKLILWKGDSGVEIAILVKRYKAYPEQKYKKGFKAEVSNFIQNENSFISRIKSINRLMLELAEDEARARGFDEALLLNTGGYIAEGARSNIFFVKNKIIFTPSLDCGCLNGVTRKVIFDFAKKERLKIVEGKFVLQDLYNADEAFLTNSLIGIMPLVMVEDYKIVRGTRGNITGHFMEKYNYLLKL